MSSTTDDAIEVPSGKAARDENFPVGSRLLPARLRPHVATFYAFARAADDIADNPTLTPEVKRSRIDQLAAALDGSGNGRAIATAARMRESLAATGVAGRHCLDLLDAFRQDASQRRYRDWDELMEYCRRSAAPVGRYLLDLHGEAGALYPQSDALCSALQVINHLQDCGADYRDLDRVYIPEPWLEAEGLTVEALAAGRTDPALRRVLDRLLDGVDDLLAAAAPLPTQLKNGRLAMETAAIGAIARRLSALLRRRDPLAAPVRLGRMAYLVSLAEGVAREGLRRRRGR